MLHLTKAIAGERTVVVLLMILLAGAVLLLLMLVVVAAVVGVGMELWQAKRISSIPTSRALRVTFVIRQDHDDRRRFLEVRLLTLLRLVSLTCHTPCAKCHLGRQQEESLGKCLCQGDNGD